MSVAPLSELQRNKGEVRWAGKASVTAQGSRAISHGGKSASSHPDGLKAQIQRVPVAGADASCCADTVRWSWALLCKETWQAQSLSQPLTFLA